MHLLLIDEVARDLLAAFVTGRFSLGQQFVEFARFGRFDLVEPLAVSLHFTVGVGLLFKFATLFTRAL